MLVLSFLSRPVVGVMGVTDAFSLKSDEDSMIRVEPDPVGVSSSWNPIRLEPDLFGTRVAGGGM
jgi:hypothetical protein